MLATIASGYRLVYENKHNNRLGLGEDWADGAVVSGSWHTATAHTFFVVHKETNDEAIH